MPSLIGKLLNQTPIPYVSRGGISLPWRTPSGAAKQMEAMGSVGTLFNIVSTTSQAAAEVEWKLYRKSSTGNPNDRVEVTSHPAVDLWNQPNKHMTRQELVEVVQQHIDLTGEGWIVVGRDRRMRSIPLELWPVRPDQMAPEPSPTGYISSYWFTGPDGLQKPLALDDVLFMRMPNPVDNYRGLAPVTSVMLDLDSSHFAAQWNRNFFLNSAQPGGIIEMPPGKTLTDNEFDEMVARWREQHQGVANAHRVAIIEHGKWITNNYTVHDMQFVQLSGLSKEKIREAYGFPKFAAGEVDDVNRATAEASSAWFARRLTVPRLKRWKGMLNNDLLPLFGRDAAKTLEFDFISPVMEDREANNAERDSQVAALKSLTETNVEITPEVLSWIGLPPTWKIEEPEPAPAPPIQTTATVGQPVEAIEDGAPRNAGGSFLQLAARFRRGTQLLNHPGHDQKSHGRRGGGATGQAALDAAPAQFNQDSHYGDLSGARLDAPPGAGSAEALAGYHGRDYERVNRVLRISAREGAPLDEYSSEKTRTQIEEIDKTMAVSPLTSDVQVDRVIMEGDSVFGSGWYDFGGKPITTMEQAHAANERWKAGERPDLTGASWREAGYVSTTADPRVAKAIGDAKAIAGGGPAAERVIMTITAPAGTGAVRLSALDSGSRPTTEAELLLERGLTMTVTADHGVNADGYRLLDVTASRD